MRCCWTREERAGVLERVLEGLCYMDPILANNRKKYHEFIADLFQSGILGFTSRPKVQIGAFMVSKKSGALRLIVDAANRLFRTPPPPHAPCWAAWSVGVGWRHRREMICLWHKKMYATSSTGWGFPKSSASIFHCHQSSHQRCRVNWVSCQEELDSLVQCNVGPFYPHVSVMPMGFSWAFHLAHLVRTPLMRDRELLNPLGRGVGCSEKAILVYADNANRLGIDAESVNADHKVMVESLEQHGLSTHDIVEASTLAESLGIRIDGLRGRITPTCERDWRLDRALEAELGACSFWGGVAYCCGSHDSESSSASWTHGHHEACLCFH